MNLNKMRLLARLYREQDNGNGDGGNGGATPTAAPSSAPSPSPTQAPTEAPAPAPAGNGETKPTDAEAKLLKEVMRKKEALDKATAKAAELETKLKDFEGLNVEEIRAILQERKDAETKALEAKGEYDRLKQRMAEEHTKEVNTLKNTLSQKDEENARLAKQINELTIGSQFGQSKFIAEDLTLTPTKARALYGSHFEYVDGKVVGYDKPRGEPNRTMFVDSLGNPLAFDDVVRKIVDADPERDYLLRSKIKSGAGSQTKPAKVQSESSNNPLDKIAAGLATMNAKK